MNIDALPGGSGSLVSLGSQASPLREFTDQKERSVARERFEAEAGKIREEFEAACQNVVTTVTLEEGGDSIQLRKYVSVHFVVHFLRALGSLSEEASSYNWEGESPNLDAPLKHISIAGDLDLPDLPLPSLLLNRVQISGRVVFSGARFLGPVSITRSVVEGDVIFDGSEFPQGLFFEGSSFRGGCYFNAVACQTIRWSKTVFHGSVTCMGMQVASGAIVDSEFRGSACFESAKFFGLAKFSGSVFASLARFDNALFRKRARFLNCKFQNQTLFSSSDFASCPHFHGAEVHPDTTFSRCRFRSMESWARLKGLVSALDVWRKRPSRGLLPDQIEGQGVEEGGRKHTDWNTESRAYRTLKLHMTKHQAQQEASRFFAGEMRCHRRDFGLARPVHYLVSLLYDLFSEFGQSAGRVLVWLVLFNAVFTYGYYAQAQDDMCALRPSFGLVGIQDQQDEERPPSWDESLPWAALSLQSLNPVAFLSPKSTWVRVYDGRLFVAGMGQSLMNLILIVLLGISLRGQFRRGAGGGE